MDESDKSSPVGDMPLPRETRESASPELVFGLVGPLGCNIDAVQECLVAELLKVKYVSTIIHITNDVKEAIPELKSQIMANVNQKIEVMNKVVEASGTADFLAKIAIGKIISTRRELNKASGVSPDWLNLAQVPGRAYIIRQLKRPHEIDILRRVYGRKFIQVSVVVSEAEQLESVASMISRDDPAMGRDEIGEESRRLVARDREEVNIKFGQRLINAYHSADVFIGGSVTEVAKQTERFMQAFFGSNYISPTRDELGSYFAKAASLRTLDLSRQVGAAILNETGDIISIGCNEVPRPGGGNYWCDDKSPQRDIERGIEANKLETSKIIADFVYALAKHQKVKMDPKEVLSDPEFGKIMKDTLVSDLTEFGRMAHAEMSALADAARLGLSTKGATIYVTTFPCHNCAKHLVAAGLDRIVYIEPYLKSRAFDLSSDALSAGVRVEGKVLVQHFVGISPRRFRDIFEKPKKRRDDNNKIKKWHYDEPLPMIEDKMWTHTYAEANALKDLIPQIELVKTIFQRLPS
ncbi:MAG: deaminase [Paracoccaceae bacterium]